MAYLSLIKKEGVFLKTTKTMVFLALFISMAVVLTRFFSIQTPIIRIGFGFLPIALASIMFGPISGGIVAAISDIIGMVLFPNGAYFPGFTLSAFFSGIIYGVVLYKKPISIIRVSIAILIITLFIDLGLNTLWLSMITGKAVSVLIVPRIIKSSIMFPIQTFLIHVVWRCVQSFVQVKYINR